MSKCLKKIVVVGGGPAGLMAAERLSKSGYRVDLYDAMPSVARKFLLAGIGGMNITHSEPFDDFINRYAVSNPWLKPYLKTFGPDDLIKWIHGLGVRTIIGSSGRVFPEEMKAAPLLRRWKNRLIENGVVFHPRHKWLNWSDDSSLLFSSPDGEKTVDYDVLVLAVGGGSWRKLGSDGTWIKPLLSLGIEVEPLVPSNCGWTYHWSPLLKEKAAGQPIKQVGLSVVGQPADIVSEVLVTDYGIEGTGIYALGRYIRAAKKLGEAVICLDLMPNKSASDLIKELGSSSSKDSISNRLRKTFKFTKAQIALLNESGPLSGLTATEIAGRIKCIELSLGNPRPIDEAISTAGGVLTDMLNDSLMLKKMPGVFIAGEMIDWDAPTGGYLLTACLSTGFSAGDGAVDWLNGLTA